jgi:hypothetical protein
MHFPYPVNLKRLFGAFILLLLSFQYVRAQYDTRYVGLSNETIDGELYTVVEMTRKDGRVKVKYFAGKDLSGKSVFKRYQEWSKGKSIISVCTGTYYDHYDRPVGICIDDGRTVNNAKVDDMDGLVVVYNSGEIVASDLDKGPISFKDSKGSTQFDLRNTFDRSRFFNWSKENKATVFQSHLLCYQNEMRFVGTGSSSQRKRRFLAVTKDPDQYLHYYLVNIESANTLFKATKKLVKFLGRYTKDIHCVINLDTGRANAYEVRDSKGRIIDEDGFRGEISLKNSKNLLVFYFE